MSRPITLTEDAIKSSVKKFEEQLRSYRLFDGKIKYEDKYEYEADEEDRVKIIFTPMAFVKMMLLVHKYDVEIAWQGVVKRSERESNTYIISDIYVYPQTVTSVTVEMDDDKYPAWSAELSDEVFNNLHFQGHSHVKMGTTPSSVDLKHQQDILNTLKSDSFYIFMIWNKMYDWTASVFDLAENTVYESKEIDVVIGEEEQLDINEYIKDVKKVALCENKTNKWGGYSGYYNQYNYTGKSSKDEKHVKVYDDAKRVEAKDSVTPKATIGRPYYKSVTI